MNILVIGSGGREHALCFKMSKSKKASKIYCAPGNGGTRDLAQNVDIASNDIDGLLRFAIDKDIDLTIVGPEEPLVLGIVDKFKENNLRIFGPDKKASKLEASKEFSKKFMEKYDIKTAKYKSFTDYDEAIKGVKNFSYPLVIKADGLCLGKGVIICENEEDTIATLKDILKEKIFGDQGQKVIIEEFIYGVEASLICLVSGNEIIAMESAKDYKKILEGDKGLNTGGIGAYSPSELFTDKLKEKIEKAVLEKISIGLKEEKLEYNGIIFIGFMIEEDDIEVLEFNVRFGDPETEVLLPRLESDLIDIFEKTIDNKIKESDLIWTDQACVTVVTSSRGYPKKCEKGFSITGLKDLSNSLMVFHNGSKYENGELVTNGGRVLSITSLGEDINSARENIYKEIHKIKFDGMYYRKDIAIY
ncbi:MAG: phosphoribosylamine--glycine ligase [Senegalia sp. (in: firmicutes)]|uniref:phosphoribosylamine--glycine ligase n=1 Tax=Senegalia sp. (in: firmicutes) TaxID=1924098 RepID=UPI003F95DBBB